MTAHYPNTAEKALPLHVPAVGWCHLKRYGLYCSGLKRGLDVLAVLFCLPVIFPLIVILALLISMDGHSPLYRQKRLGNNGSSSRSGSCAAWCMGRMPGLRRI